MKVEVISHKDEVLDALRQQMEAGLEACGQVAEGYAKLECPVRTGRLRDSISHVVDDWHDVYIGTNVEYAPYVENGARGRAPKHFLRNAASNHGAEYRQILENHLKS